MAVVKSRSALMTAENFAAPDVPEKLVELIEGELVAMTPAGHRHNRIGMNVAFLFRQFCVDRPGLDYCGDNNGFLIQRNPDTVLSPDACLFTIRPNMDATWLEFAPELVVEVVSPSNSKAELAFKRKRFFAAGTEQFWLVDGDTTSVQIFHRDGGTVEYSGDATIDGEGIASGLRVPLKDVFRLR